MNICPNNITRYIIEENSVIYMTLITMILIVLYYLLFLYNFAFGSLRVGPLAQKRINSITYLGGLTRMSQRQLSTCEKYTIITHKSLIVATKKQSYGLELSTGHVKNTFSTTHHINKFGPSLKNSKSILKHDSHLAFNWIVQW